MKGADGLGAYKRASEIEMVVAGFSPHLGSLSCQVPRALLCCQRQSHRRKPANDPMILTAHASPPTATFKLGPEAPGKKKLACTRNAFGTVFGVHTDLSLFVL